MVYNVVFWLNVFPHKDGVHKVMSPHTILTGLHITHDKHCTLEFGTYVQIHEEHDNSMTARTSGAIALRPTGNIQGTHYFLNVSSGRCVTRNNWTALPMPNEVIHAIHRLAAACKKYKEIVFTDSRGKIIDDNSPEHETEIEEITGVGNTTYLVSITGVYSTGVSTNSSTNENKNTGNNTNVNENENSTELGVTHDDISENTPEEMGVLPALELQEIHTAQETEGDDNDAYVTPTRQELDTLEEMNATNMRHDMETATKHMDTDNQVAETHEEYNEADNSAGHGYNLRPRPTRRREKISLLQVTRQSACEAVSEKPHLHVLMTQMSIRAGIKKFGQKGNEAVSKELRQLHDRRAMVPVQKNKLSAEDKKRALRYLMFIKEKRDGAIKARGCADGRPQRQYTEKGDASSPTVSLEEMMISCCIDAKEGRYVAVTDIPGAFLHADMNERIHIVMEGTVAEQVAKLEPTIYRKYIWHDRKGKPMLYVRLKKALYGTLQAALLFWQLLSETLVSWGFTINPYDQCVANKQINGRQCTIVWHVDDLKISHVSEDVVENIIACLNKKFGKESPLTTSRGKILEYLGLTLDYSKKGRVKISMYEYVKKSSMGHLMT